MTWADPACYEGGVTIFFDTSLRCSTADVLHYNMGDVVKQSVEYTFCAEGGGGRKGNELFGYPLLIN